MPSTRGTHLLFGAGGGGTEVTTPRVPVVGREERPRCVVVKSPLCPVYLLHQSDSGCRCICMFHLSRCQLCPDVYLASHSDSFQVVHVAPPGTSRRNHRAISSRIGKGDVLRLGGVEVPPRRNVQPAEGHQDTNRMNARQQQQKRVRRYE